MTKSNLLQMHNVGIVVKSFDNAISFLEEIGLKLEGRAMVEGEWAGNHIILEYQNNMILMAHMLKNSLMVSTGDIVKKGQPIARVGNSGRTIHPHLHIHAIAGTDTSKIIEGGNGIPIYFDGKFPIRNDRIKKYNN